MEALRNPAFWAALGVLLGAIGIEIPQPLVTHVLEAVAAISGILGIVMGWRGAQP